MRITVFTLLILPFFTLAQVKKVKLKLVQVRPYCGGAKPPKEKSSIKETAISYAKKKLIYISDRQTIDTVFTDGKGNISIKLPYGEYNLYEPWKFYHTAPSGFRKSDFEEECLKEVWLREDLKITVTQKSTQVVNHLKNPKCPHQLPCLINPHLPR